MSSGIVHCGCPARRAMPCPCAEQPVGAMAVVEACPPQQPHIERGGRSLCGRAGALDSDPFRSKCDDCLTRWDVQVFGPEHRPPTVPDPGEVWTVEQQAAYAGLTWEQLRAQWLAKDDGA